MFIFTFDIFWLRLSSTSIFLLITFDAISHLVVAHLLIFCLFSGKIFAQKSSYDSDSSSATLTESQKVLVPGSESGESVSDENLDPDQILNDPKVAAWFVITNMLT